MLQEVHIKLIGNCRELQDNPRKWWPAEKVAEAVKEHAEKLGTDVVSIARRLLQAIKGVMEEWGRNAACR